MSNVGEPRFLIHFLDGVLAGRQFSSDSADGNELQLATILFRLSGEGTIGKRVDFKVPDQENGQPIGVPVSYLVSHRLAGDDGTMICMKSVPPRT